jgi:CubicO group peptidase (beta-lactamase class C family)
MPHRVAPTVPLALALLLPLPAWAQAVPAPAPAPSVSPAPAAPATREEAAARLVEQLRERVGSPGMAAAVFAHGRLAWSAAFGRTDVENGVVAWPHARFRVGSVSKLFTIAALARLLEQGRIDLDAPIQRYVPGFPDKGTPVTLRLLAGHLSGIRHYQPRDYPEPRNSTVRDGLAVFKDDPLLHPPGAQYLYSSYGFNLIGAAIESVSGQEFGVAVRELVLQPLDLRDTRVDDPKGIVERRSAAYSRDSRGELVNADPIDSRYKAPSGGFISTAEDLARFGAAHLGDGFLRAETRRLLFTPQSTTAGKETGVGLAWRVGTSPAGRRILHHGGAIEGGRAFLLLLPDQQVVVALTANLSAARYAEADAEALAELFLR